MFDDLTLYFSASKKDITLYPVRQTIKKLALVVVWVVSLREIKGFSGQPVTAAGIFWGDYGYLMGTLNSQTHFKIGDASLFKATFSSDIKLLIDI